MLYEVITNGDISWTDNGSFALDGQPLYVFKNSFPTSIEYRVKSSNRIKVIAYNFSNDANEPSYFKVFSQSGDSTYYGRNNFV